MAEADRRYKNVSWSTGDSPTTEKLNQMAANDQWLFENMPKAVYNSAGVKIAAGIKILAGSTPYPVTSTDWASIPVSFGNYFSAGSHPVVAAVVSSGPSYRKTVTVSGLDGYEQIDHRGFQAHITTLEWLYDGGRERTITRIGLVNWIAVGY